MGKSVNFLLVIAIATLLAFASGCQPTVHINKQEIYSMNMSRSMKKMFCIKEPLQIVGEDDGDYILPVGTVLYYDNSFDEGHALYWTPFYHKGKIDWEEVHLEPKHQGNLIVPLLLYNIDAEQLKDLLKRFPLSKSDIKSAIRANEITKDDLIDIIRSMPEE
jgi:hypothetical protein